MIDHTKSHIKKILKIEFIRFCIVGGTGFVINFILLTLLHKGLGIDIFVSQLVGAEVSLFSNFMLHHHWTYKAHKVDKSMTGLIVQFHATSWPAIVGSAVMVSVGEKIFHLSDLFALVVSSAIALLWNFFWSKYIIWKDVTPAEVEGIVK